MNSLRNALVALSAAAMSVVLFTPQPASAQQAGGKRPNILVIFGDDVGQSNISAYSRGLMGFTTPTVDRIDAEDGRHEE